ncbi:exopolysaccharide biosynthesis protein, partial [Steroidobacter sp.]|uniref:exopolysaccharide biosynthesis protein n=1 Tax=Steroidobacter sp. TaxID=1978227 RepID=UPI001A51B7E3
MSVPPPAAQLLLELAETIDTEMISVGDLMQRLDRHGVGLTLLILALPMCLPNIPGISTLFGILMIAPALQLTLGRATLWMPGRLRNFTMRATHVQTALRASAPLLRKIERFSTPRWTKLVIEPATSLIGIQTLVMALVLILPMWGANLIPGIAVTLTGIGILQRDGAFILTSTLVAIGA